MIKPTYFPEFSDPCSVFKIARSMLSCYSFSVFMTYLTVLLLLLLQMDWYTDGVTW